MWEVNDGIGTQDTGFIVTSFLSCLLTHVTSSHSIHSLTLCHLLSTCCVPPKLLLVQAQQQLLNFQTQQSHQFLPYVTSLLLLIQKKHSVVEIIILASVAPFCLVFFNMFLFHSLLISLLKCPEKYGFSRILSLVVFLNPLCNLFSY